MKNLKATKGSALAVEGDIKEVERAILQLESGSIDKEDIKKKRLAKNPRKKGRFVEVEQNKIKTNSSIQNLGNNKTSDIEVNQENDFSYQTQIPFSLNDEKGSSNKNASSNGAGEGQGIHHSYANMQLRTPQVAEGLPNFGNNHNANPNGGGVPREENRNAAREPAGAEREAAGQRGINNEETANRRQAPNNGGNQPANNPANARNFGPLPVPDQNLRPDEARPNVQGENVEEDNTPVVTVEVTEAGCQPRIDRIHERVIIQNRIKRLENGVIVDEGQCSDSLEIYPIMKDYLCDNCTDIVNREEKKAYSQYQEFWFNRDNQRVALGDTLYTDRTRPYHFRDEVGNCEIEIDFEASTAHKQVETVYFNFNHVRKVVDGCHRAPNVAPIPLIETTKGCPIIHDFTNRVSHEQKRIIYKLEGVPHEVRACQSIMPPLQHEFVEMGCRPIIDIETQLVTKTARRRINTSKGYKIITEDCEPEGNNNLQLTREGCEGEYFHDFNLLRSYFKKRYYFMRDNNQREFVSGCVRSNDFIPMRTEHNGSYEHDDNTRVSRQKLSLYLDTEEQGRVFLDEARVRRSLGEVPYTLQRNQHRALNTDYYFEGCYRRTRTRSINIYHRADGISYEHDIGAGNVIKSWKN